MMTKASKEFEFLDTAPVLLDIFQRDRMAPKVPHSSIMQYSRGIRPLLGLVLALAASALSRGAATVAIGASPHSVATAAPEEVLSLSPTDYGWHSAGGLLAT